MSDIIYPRSPRETMDGWMYLPRFVDKTRLHLAGKLHSDYQNNFGKGFDGMWLEAAGAGHWTIFCVLTHVVAVRNLPINKSIRPWLGYCYAITRPLLGHSAIIYRFLIVRVVPKYQICIF